MKDISVGVVVALCALSDVAAPTLEEGFCPSAERGEAAHVVSHDERQHREGGHHTRLQGAREGGRRREDAEFRAALADPLAWLYADSRVDAVEGMDEIDVPANGVIDANILLNGLTPGEPHPARASHRICKAAHRAIHWNQLSDSN